MRRRWLPVSVLLAVLGATGCAIGPEDAPSAVEMSIPASPLDRPAPEPDEVAATVYLVAADELVPVRRNVLASASSTDRLHVTLEALVSGPSDAEVSDGIRSAVPATTEILGVEISAGTARVDLGDDFLRIGGGTEILAVGQIVVTAATHPGVQRVALSVAGEPVALPLPNGALREEPVELGQYALLLGPGVSAAISSTTSTTANTIDLPAPTAPDPPATSASTSPDAGGT